MINPRRYRTKPITVEAVRIISLEEQQESIIDWIGVATLSSAMFLIQDGDWIVKYENFYEILTPEDFEKKYELIMLEDIC
jgi:hypothetical protein